jgi:competence protein ComEA
VGDLVAVAGGYGGRVDTARAERELNQAARLQDGDQIRVPARGEPEHSQATGGGPAAAAPDQGLIDLNSATDAELDALPGIGPVTVAKIVAAREEAPFTTIEDLRTRGLVGQKTFDNIRGSLVVR